MDYQTLGKVILSPARCWSSSLPSELKMKIEKALCSKPLGLSLLKVCASFFVSSLMLLSLASTIISFSVAMKANCPSLKVVEQRRRRLFAVVDDVDVDVVERDDAVCVVSDE